MILDLGSVVKFLLVYVLFCVIQYIVSLLSTVFDLISAYLACKLVDFQEKLDKEKEDKEEQNCIGFQIPTNSTEKEEEEDDE